MLGATPNCVHPTKPHKTWRIHRNLCGAPETIKLCLGRRQVELQPTQIENTTYWLRTSVLNSGKIGNTSRYVVSYFTQFIFLNIVFDPWWNGEGIYPFRVSGCGFVCCYSGNFLIADVGNYNYSKKSKPASADNHNLPTVPLFHFCGVGTVCMFS